MRKESGLEVLRICVELREAVQHLNRVFSGHSISSRLYLALGHETFRLARPVLGLSTTDSDAVRWSTTVEMRRVEFVLAAKAMSGS